MHAGGGTDYRGEKRNVLIVSVCVFITAGPITKLFAGGGGGEWTTCIVADRQQSYVVGTNILANLKRCNFEIFLDHRADTMGCARAVWPALCRLRSTVRECVWWGYRAVPE